MKPGYFELSTEYGISSWKHREPIATATSGDARYTNVPSTVHTNYIGVPPGTLQTTMSATSKQVFRSNPHATSVSKPLGVVDMNIPRALQRKNQSQSHQQTKVHIKTNTCHQAWSRSNTAVPPQGRVGKKRRTTWGITISSASPDCVDLCGNSHDPYQCPKLKEARKTPPRPSHTSVNSCPGLVGSSLLNASEDTYINSPSANSMSSDYTVGCLSRTVSEGSVFPNAPDVCMPSMFDSETPRNSFTGALEFGLFDNFNDPSQSTSSGLALHDTGSPFLSSMAPFSMHLAEQETTDCFQSDFGLEQALHEDEDTLQPVYISGSSGITAHDADYFLSGDFNEFLAVGN